MTLICVRTFNSCSNTGSPLHFVLIHFGRKISPVAENKLGPSEDWEFLLWFVAEIQFLYSHLPTCWSLLKIFDDWKIWVVLTDLFTSAIEEPRETASSCCFWKGIVSWQTAEGEVQGSRHGVSWTSQGLPSRSSSVSGMHCDVVVGEYLFSVCVNSMPCVFWQRFLRY